jgi:aspartyl-tRNA synthetase
VFFGADKAKIVNEALGALRLKVGQDRGLVEAGWRPLWVSIFRCSSGTRKGDRWSAMHHPFTAPADGHEDLLGTDPGRARAKAHDMVLNGWEIGGGSVRIHRQDVQSKVFRALKISEEEAEAKFRIPAASAAVRRAAARRHCFRARSNGYPDGGCGSIRDVIAFPKTQRAQDLLTHAPNTVDEQQLRELHIRAAADRTPEKLKRSRTRFV